MLVYRIIPSLKREFLYHEDQTSHRLLALTPEGYGGYPVGSLLNGLLNIDAEKLFGSLRADNSDNVVPYREGALRRCDPLLREALAHVDLTRADCYPIEDDFDEVFKGGKWSVAALCDRLQHLRFNFLSYHLLDDRLKTDHFREYSLEKVRKLKSYTFIPDKKITREAEVRALYQTAFYAFQEGLCTIVAENKKILHVDDSDIAKLREESFGLIAQLGISRSDIVARGMRFGHLLGDVLGKGKPALEPDPLFELIEGFLHCYVADNSDSNWFDRGPHLLASFLDEDSYSTRATSLLEIQKRHDYSLASRNGTYEIYHALFQDTRIFLAEATASLAPSTKHLIMEEFEEFLAESADAGQRLVRQDIPLQDMRSLFDFFDDGKASQYKVEQNLSAYIAVPLKANLKSTLFEIDDVIDLFTVLCYGANLSEAHPSQCSLCGKLYLPAPGQNASKYCSNYHETYGMTCADASKKHRIKEGKRDYNERKHQSLRKAKRARSAAARSYFETVARFISQLGPVYRRSDKVSVEAYAEWLRHVGQESVESFEAHPEDAPFCLIWQGSVKNDRGLFERQLGSAAGSVPGLSDWVGSAEECEAEAAGARPEVDRAARPDTDRTLSDRYAGVEREAYPS